MSRHEEHFSDLKSLAELYKQGAITTEEYKAEKQQVLDQINGPVTPAVASAKTPPSPQRTAARTDTTDTEQPRHKKIEPLAKNRWYSKPKGILFGLLTLPYYLVYIAIVNKDDPKEWYLHGWGAVAAYLFLPFFALWYIATKKGHWSSRKKIAFGAPHVAWIGMIFLIGVAGATAPPAITVANLAPNTQVNVEEANYSVKGSIFPLSSIVTVNDMPVSVDSSGSYETAVALNEGMNNIAITATSGDRTTTETYTIYRLSNTEIAENKRISEEIIKTASAAVAETPEPTTAAATPVQPPHNPDAYWHKVTRVVDGDTVKALIDGQERTIRVIGIDTPESTTQQECFGNEASAKAKEFLSSKWIKLQTDPTQDTVDRYGRLLRYVTFDSSTDFGRRMIHEGYAYEYTYDKPYQRQADYQALSKKSTAASKGLWAASTCGGQRVKPAPAQPAPAPAQPKPQAQAAAPAPAPAPAPSSGCDSNYSGGCVPVVSYDLDCKDIGFMVRVVGADPHRFDANSDGYGCESYR